jgi:uncharacterized small protein (DUF1192 family)
LTEFTERENAGADFEHWDEDKAFSDEIATSEDPEFEAFTAQVEGDLLPALLEEGRDRWSELDRTAAESLMRRYRNTYRKLEDVSEVLTARVAELQEEIDRLKARADEVQRPYIRRLEWLDATVKPLLEEYARREIGNGKARSIKLLDGTLKLRHKPAGLEVEDELLAVLWAEKYAPAVVKRTIQKAALNKLFGAVGEIPDGCAVRPAEDVFSLEVEG